MLIFAGIQEEPTNWYYRCQILGHFHCQNKNLTKTLSSNYHIISAHHIQTVMNDVKTEVMNTFHKHTAIDESTTGVKDPFPWLDPEDP